MSHDLQQLPDNDLARLAQAGSLDCFEELVRRFQVPLVRFLVRRFGNTHDAEDAVQEAFVRAYTSIRSYDPDQAFKAWLYTITYRIAVTHRRRLAIGTAPTAGNGECLDVDSRQPPPGHDMERSDDARLLWSTARRVLTDDQFTVLWLHYVEEMPTRDMAKVLGRSWVGVKTLMFRARAKLLEHLPDSIHDSKAGRP